MMIEGGSRSRSHGIKKQILKQQAHLLGIPIQFYSASWNDYERVFLNALEHMKQLGVSMGVFGDIKTADDPDWSSHRIWADRMCAKANIVAFEPLRLFLLGSFS